MKGFFYNRHNSCLAFMTDGWHFKNLPANRNSLDFCTLPEEIFINSDLSRVRLLAHAYAAGFDSFLSNSKLFRKQS